jgi:hypothetical protein
MSQTPSEEEVVRALGELGRGAVPVEEAGRVAYRRERVVRAMSRQLAAVNGTRPKRTRFWAGVAAAALLVLGAGGALTLASRSPAPVEVARAPAGEVRAFVGDVSVRRGDLPARAVSVGDVFQGGESLRTGSRSGLELGIESGRARLQADSALDVVRPTAKERRLRLGRGGVDVDLPTKLTRGEHLVIETPDADVLVVGTAFTVDLRSEAGQSVTVVEVRRGTVWVQRDGRQEAVLRAGQGWRSSARAERPVIEAPVATAEPARTIGKAPRAARAAAPVVRSPAVDSGTLAEENRLFEAGLAARNAGDYAAAAESFRTLLSRYPATVLSEQALAGQFRSLEKAGRLSRAVVAARRYLASYPQGFARADAERLTASRLGDR